MSEKNEYKITFRKILLHFHMINKHRFFVFRLACRVGIPWRGLVHDLSKYSPTEFWESVKYYTGDHSPITNARNAKGYSEAFLHHKGRNKHHYEYWYDFDVDQPLMIPYKYVKEIICDNLAARHVLPREKLDKPIPVRLLEQSKRSHENE